MPGSPDEQHHLAVAVLGPGPALEQDAQLVLAPDQRREPLAVQRLEAAFGATLAFDPPGRERLGEALEPQRAEVGQLEQAADQPPGRLADRPRCPAAASAWSRAARFGVSPTTACSCAAPSPISSPTTTRPVAMPTRAASGSPAGVCSRATACDHRQPGAHRPLGLVLVRLRPAEVGEHPVAHVLGDVALAARDRARHSVLVGADDVAHVLGIEPAASSVEPTRSQNMHRQLPPLGARLRLEGLALLPGCRAGWIGPWSCCCSNRAA